MLSLITIFVFCLGAIVGSFLGVALDRYNTNRTMGGRSKCFTCNRNLGALEMVPIFSQIFLKGKCKGCKTKISNEYIIMEMLSGVVFVMVFYKFLPYFGLVNPFYFFGGIAIALIVFSSLLVISFYDYRHKLIPTGYLYLFLITSFFGMFLLRDVALIGDILAGPIVAFPFYFLWVISKGKWIGLGDAKLALGMGWFLGLSSATTAILLSFWMGAAVAIILMLLRGTKYKMQTEIPFGPFLVFGTFIAFVYSLHLEDILISIIL